MSQATDFSVSLSRCVSAVRWLEIRAANWPVFFASCVRVGLLLVVIGPGPVFFFFVPCRCPDFFFLFLDISNQPFHSVEA